MNPEPEDSIASLPDAEDLGFSRPGDNTIVTDVDPQAFTDTSESHGLGEPVYLDDQERADFETLVTFGRKSLTADVWGHTVLVSTLTVEEELAIGLLVKPYRDSDAYHRAYKTAVVAASVVEIDGQPLYMPLSSHEDNHQIMRKKWEKVRSYYPPVVDQMYRAVTDLEAELFGLLEKLAKKTSG